MANRMLHLTNNQYNNDRLKRQLLAIFTVTSFEKTDRRHKNVEQY